MFMEGNRNHEELKLDFFREVPKKKMVYLCRYGKRELAKYHFHTAGNTFADCGLKALYQPIYYFMVPEDNIQDIVDEGLFCSKCKRRFIEKRESVQ